MNNLLLLNLIHILNDGFESSFLLLLPFIANDLHLNLAQVGLLGTIESSIGLPLVFPAGLLAKKFGGLQVIAIAFFMYCFGYLATGFSPSFTVLIFTFALTGIGFGSFHSIAFALIAKWTDPTKRGLHIGNFTAIGDAGRIAISALLTFIIVYIGWRYTTLLYALIGIIACIIFSFLVFKKRDAITIKEKVQKNISFIEILKHKLFLLANLTNFLDTFASNSLFIFLPFLLLKRGINPSILGMFTAIFFVGNFLGKSLLGRFADKFGNTKTFIISELCMVCMIIILANMSSVIAIIGSSFVLGIFTKGTIPVIKTLISDSAEHHGNFEKAFSINNIVDKVGLTTAPILLGVISNQFGIVTAFNFCAAVAFLATIPAFVYHNVKRNL
jgi:FSR family fosmidomycin resistance protein-like MFS transporter